MKIAFFVQYSNPVGTYFRWHNFAISLQKAGHDIDVYAGDNDWRATVRTENKDGIPYHIVPSLLSVKVFHNPNDPISGIRRLFHLPKKQYDVYHLFQPFMHAFIPWWYLQKKSGKAVFIYDWDDLWTGGLLGNSVKTLRARYIRTYVAAIEKKAQRLSDGVTVCSEFLKERVTSTVPVGNIPNGFYPQGKVDKQGNRSLWKLESDKFYLAYIGKTAGELDWIIDGFQLLRSSGFNNVRLIICGPPRELMGSYNVLNDADIMFLGEVTPKQAVEIAAASDLGLVPLEDSPFNQSRFPIKFFDFLAVGTPLYLSNVGEVGKLASLIQGVFAAPSQKDLWIKQLPVTINHIQQQQITVNIESLISNYSWQAITKELVSFYEQVIATSGKTAENKILQ